MNSLKIHFYFFFVIASTQLFAQNLKPFNELAYLNNKKIIEHKVRKVHVSVLDKPQEIYDPENPSSCLFSSFEFDDKGNLIRHQPPHVSFRFLYIHNSENQVIDWAWERDNEALVTRKEIHKDEPDIFKASLTKIKADINHQMHVKHQFNKPMFRRLIDICSNIDADYEFIGVNKVNGLPRFAKGTLTQDYIFERNDKLKSPQTLYIYFDYEFYGEHLAE